MGEEIVISVVIPVFRSKAILPALQERLSRVLDGITRSWEVILVDDGSRDGTWEVMAKLRERDRRYKLIQLVRNHGQQYALLCGVQHASGKYVVTMDDDLQNPPEEIPNFLAKIDQGYDVVIGRIDGEKKHHHLRNVASRMVRRLVEHILRKPRTLALSSYRAMSRTAVDAIAAYRGAHPYFPALMLNSVPVDRITNIDVRHDARAHGKSTYTIRKMVKLASFLLINHSTIPLRFVTVWGLLLSVGAFLFAGYVFVRALFFGYDATGWPSLAILVSFLSGNILLGLGIIGEYVGRILEEISRPVQFYIGRKEL